MLIPDCYDADRQAEARDLAYTARIMRRPRCYCCGEHILTETCMDLSSLGLKDAYICEKCMESNTKYTYELDNDNE